MKDFPKCQPRPNVVDKGGKLPQVNKPQTQYTTNDRRKKGTKPKY